MKHYCNQCQTELPGDAKFCAHCGAAALEPASPAALEYCTQCGTPWSVGAAFCGQCGAANHNVATGGSSKRLTADVTRSATSPKPDAHVRSRPSRQHNAPKGHGGARAAAIVVLVAVLGLAAWQLRGDGDDLPTAPPATQPAQLQATASPPKTPLNPQLAAAKAERDTAFERYTRLSTDSTQPGDRESALVAYREANSRFQALTAAADAASTGVSDAPAASNHGDFGRIEAEPSEATAAAPASISPRMLTDLQSLAQAGDASAQTSLALIYQTAAPGEADPAAAVELLESAAAAGDADAMNALADAYSDGVWVGQDLRKAQSLRRKAAEAGSRLAQWELEL